MLHSYQHIITGAKSPIPTDFLGGILADDMGLGKTLTMISAIVGSLPRANEYACHNPIVAESDEDDSKIPRTSKSTLIIVPSECKLPIRSL
jgi:SWI/SNF-related matrix-associated actin-dependent regulator of chromatin subfamily A3